MSAVRQLMLVASLDDDGGRVEIDECYVDDFDALSDVDLQRLAEALRAYANHIDFSLKDQPR